MSNKKDYSNIKTTTLISVIIHGANEFGVNLAETLAEQGSKVLVIDAFDKDTKAFVQRLKKNKQIDFVAFEGLDELYKTLGRFDYLFYLQFAALTDDTKYTSKNFLDESSRLEKTVTASLKHKAKISLITSLDRNKRLVEITQLENGKPKAYSDIEIQRYSETLAAEHYDKSNLNIRIIRLASMIGSGFYGDGDDTLEKLLYDSVSKDRLTIKGEGLDNHYIVNTSDAIYGVLKLTFNNQTSGEVITLSNPKALTTLSVAYKLLELNTEAKRIDFEEDSSEALYQGHYTPAPNASKFDWNPKVSIENTFIEALKDIYKDRKKKWEVEKDVASQVSTTSELDKKHVAQTVKTPFGKAVDKIISPFKKLWVTKPGNTKTVSGKFLNLKSLGLFALILTIFLLASYFILTPVFNLIYGGYRASEELKVAYQHTEVFDLEQASQSFEKTDEHIKLMNTGMSRLKWLLTAVGQKDLHDNASQLLYAAGYAISGAKDMAESLDPLAKYFTEFEPALSLNSEIPTETREYREYLEELQNRRFQLIKAADTLQFASNQISLVDTKAFPQGLQKYVVELKENNSMLTDTIKPFQETIYFLPELLGVNERHRYLLLLQNPAEIRSTGGWISSYAIIGIEGGQIRQLDVDDIYNLDGTLVVQGKSFEPPVSMQNALEIDNWSMSLSNWDPDFSKSSGAAEFFVKEAGKAYNIDGVFAMDTEVVAKLLEKWGEIEVEGETEPITSENLQAKMFEIHNEFTPGSQRKSTFIADLANAVITKLIHDKSTYGEVMSTLYESLNEKHLLINFSNSDANKFFAQQNWDGSLGAEYNSTPIPVEWNWGANKANIFIEETTSLKIRISDEKNISYSYELAVKNNSTTETYPEGAYENWHRLYLPEYAEIVSTNGFSSNTQTYTEDGYKILGGWFNTPTTATNKLSVSYTLNAEKTDLFPIKVVDDNIILDLTIFKQPGLIPGEYKIEVEYPDSWAIIDDSDLNRSINLVSGEFTQTADKDLKFKWEYK